MNDIPFLPQLFQHVTSSFAAWKRRQQGAVVALKRNKTPFDEVCIQRAAARRVTRNTKRLETWNGLHA